MLGDSEKVSGLMLGLWLSQILLYAHTAHEVLRWKTGGGGIRWSGGRWQGIVGGAYVRPVDRLTPARKAEMRTASKV